MGAIRKFWCFILARFGRDHDWRRARKGEVLGAFKVCRRCGTTKAIKVRAAGAA